MSTVRYLEGERYHPAIMESKRGPGQMRNDAPAPPPTPGPAEDCRVFTVGHSHHELAYLLDLLRAAGVGAVADVRSSPFSRRLPQYNRPELEQGLKEAGVVYVFLGDELGGRPPQLSLYDDEGRV